MPRMSWKPKSCTSRTKCSGKIENEKRWKNDHRKVKTIHLGEKMPKMSKGLKIDVAWWNQIWKQVFAWTHGNAMKRNSRNSLHPKRLNRLIPLACVSRKAPWSIQSIQFCCPRRSAHKNASNKKSITSCFSTLTIAYRCFIPHETVAGLDRHSIPLIIREDIFWLFDVWFMYAYISLAPRVGQRTPRNQHCKGP